STSTSLPQHVRYSEYEIGMAVQSSNTAVRMDWELPPIASWLMAAVQEYRTQHPTPSYY
ncbi:hypothetical protein A2U01_0117952, partial [Trifolium medium]|nr:hypothetical protein [Trifolium medium]